MERKRIFKQYLFSLAVLFCLLAFFAGITTVSERTRYNMDLTAYSEISLEESETGLRICFGDRELFIDKEHIEKMGKDAFYGMMGDVFQYIGNFFEKNAV